MKFKHKQAQIHTLGSVTKLFLMICLDQLGFRKWIKSGKKSNTQHTHTCRPVVDTLVLLIWAQVNCKHVLILWELFPTFLFSPSSSRLWSGLPPPLSPLFGHPTIALLESHALDRKWAAGNGGYAFVDEDSINYMLIKITFSRSRKRHFAAAPTMVMRSAPAKLRLHQLFPCWHDGGCS